MFRQRTLSQEVVVEGTGLHTGAPARVKLIPAESNTGICFVRTDLSGTPVIPAQIRSVVSTQLATTLGLSPQVTVSTVEHLLAALFGAGIDNLRIEVDGPEVPILDGSAGPFYAAIQEAGVSFQSESRTYLAVRKKIEVKLGEKWAVVEPAAGFEVKGSIDWDHPSIGHQEFQYIEGKTDFETLASARTFGFLREVEALRQKGLARGGSLENAVVLDDALILNPEGLRFPNEFARHKVLDALGDLKLAGYPILGAFKLHRAGHDLHCQLLRELFQHAENFEFVGGAMPLTQRLNRVQAVLMRGLAASL
jgi:UDP-3-O-[3-hydroxymyristoyl] N-acetylglucosamine deacetylase